MNSICIIGNITKAIELKYTQSQKAITNVTLAYNEGFGDKQETYYFDIQVWGKQAENLHKYCNKGSKIAVEGKLIQQKWTNDKGENRSKVLINATNIQFLETKKGVQAVSEVPKEEKEEDTFADFGNQIEIKDEDLPF